MKRRLAIGIVLACLCLGGVERLLDVATPLG
jgi:hypothetical protein